MPDIRKPLRDRFNNPLAAIDINNYEKSGLGDWLAEPLAPQVPLDAGGVAGDTALGWLNAEENQDATMTEMNMHDLRMPKGVWPVMVTPFEENGVIDWPGYESLIEFYIGHGVAGLFANCGSSEAVNLSVEEMLALIGRAVAQAAGRVPVVGGALVKREPDALAPLIREIGDLGVGAVVLAPSLLVEADEGESALRDRIAAVLGMTDDIPLGIYEWPAPYHRLLSPEVFGWIARTGHFVFHKDTCCDMDTISEKLRRTRGTPLRFFNANLATLAQSLELGGDGYCGIGANYYPEAYVRLCSLADTAPAAARKLQSLVMSVEDRLFGTPAYPLSAKAILNMRGVRIKPVCRNYDGPLRPEDRRRLSQIWREFQEGFKETP